MRFPKGDRSRFIMTAALTAAALLVSPPAGATTYSFGVDVPSNLGGTDYTVNQVVKRVGATYALDAELSADVALGAIHLRSDGTWLFAPSHAVTLGGTDYQARDVVVYDGAVYSIFLDGSAAGIPAEARIDALFLDAAGHPVVSLDVPASLGGNDYGRSDLILHNGAFSLYWDADVAGVPDDSNLVGASRDGADTLVVSFDVPTRLGGTEYLPGQLVQWNGGAAFASYVDDPSWPRSSQLRDFSFSPAAGEVPDGAGVPGVPLAVDKGLGGNVTLTWSPSCRSGDADYAVYEGSIGSFASHTSRFCTTGGATTKTFAPAGGSAYYLVVPKNARSEGSYGRSSDDSERPQGSPACVPQEVGTCQ